MTLSLSSLKRERQGRSATGFDQVRFEKLAGHFEAAYGDLHGQSMSERQADCLISPKVTQCAELLFFTLFSFKSGLTYDLLGLVSGMDGSTAKRTQSAGVAVLAHALARSGHAPARHLESPADLEALLAQADTLLLDATELRIQRPQDPERQRAYYSGKKKSTPSRQ